MEVMPSPFVLMARMWLLFPSYSSIASEDKSLSSGVVFSFNKQSLKSAFVAWCFIPTRYKTSNWNSYSQRCYCSNWPVLSVKFRIHFNESWLVRVVNPAPSRSVSRSNTVDIIARHSFFVLLHLRSASGRDLDQYQIGFGVSSCCCWLRSHPTWESHSSVSSAMWADKFESAKTGGEIRASFSVIKKLIFSSKSASKVVYLFL